MSNDNLGLNKYSGKCSLIEVIYEQIKLNNIEESKKHTNVCKFYPSSSGMCNRRIVYQMLGYDQGEFSGKLLMIFDNGNSMHTRIEHLFDTTGLLIAPELSFEKLEWRVSGRSDAILHNFLPHKSSNNIIELKEPIYELEEDGSLKKDTEGKKILKEEKLLFSGPDNDAIIVELKSISEKGFNYLDRGGAKKEHQLQLQLYMHLTGIKQGMLLYENKNTQELKEFFLEYNPNIAQLVVDQIIFVNKCVDENVIPDREYEQSDFQCRYCPYATICWPTNNPYKVSEILTEV